MSELLKDSDLFDMEEFLFNEPDSLVVQCAVRLLSEVRKLRHEAEDPNYQYSGRIHRNAILSRDMKIDKLRTENGELKKRVGDLEKQVESFTSGGQ